MTSDSQQNRLPFEPDNKRKNRKKTAKQQPATPTSAPERRSYTKEERTIPPAVSQRMVRRMALFCGIPTAMGVATFFASYFIVTREILPLPNTAVVLTSMGCFGLGVLGLSYGVLSSSWEEDIEGSALGWTEFKTNWGRMVNGWRASRQKN
jgi:hypothetical protein